MKTMLDSKEFWSEGAYRAKMKSPLEMIASAVRAVDGDVDFAFPLANQMAQLGQPLYRKQEPTGYSNSSQEWVNSAGLLARMNFALPLADEQGAGREEWKAAKPTIHGGIAGLARFSKAVDWEVRKPMTTRRIFLRNSALAMFGVGTAPLWLPRALVRRRRALAAQEDPGGDFPARRGRRPERRGAARREGLLRPASDDRRFRGPSQRRSARTRRSIWTASSDCIPRSRR